MAPPKPIELPSECIRDLVLGQVVEALNSLRESNEKDHTKIFERLDEGDKYLTVLKIPRKAIAWLDGKGFFYSALTIMALAVAGWLIGKI